MSGRRDRATEAGASHAPDLVSADLRWLELETLGPEFEVERARLGGARLSGAEAGSGRIAESQLEDVDLDQARLRGLALVDVLAARLAAANGDWGGALLRRARFSNSRLTGLSLGEAKLDEVRFEDCKLDYVNFRHAALEHVTFAGCVLSGADFQGAELRSVRFDGCTLTEADFSRAEFEQVDFRGSELALAGSLLGLQGAIVDSLQLIDLARPLAAELGISIRDE